jgi:hypothetical protein
MGSDPVSGKVQTQGTVRATPIARVAATAERALAGALKGDE